MMHKGRLVEVGTTSRILSDPRETYTQEFLATVPRMYPAASSSPQEIKAAASSARDHTQ